VIILAILLPPLAVFLSTHNPVRAALNFLLWCCFIVPGVIHAIICVNEAKTGKMIRQAQR
jgi:uncharacterized membrane protein YqaE (UPF0057 family)